MIAHAAPATVRRTALNLLLALALSLVYAHAQYRVGDDRLNTATVGTMLDQLRGAMWLEMVILSDVGYFPAYSTPFLRRLEASRGIRLVDFRPEMVHTRGNAREVANAGDDLGLPFVGVVLRRVLQVDRVLVGLLWFWVGLSWWCMFFCCFYAFRKGAYLFGLLVPGVLAFAPELKEAERDYLDFWLPHGYLVLMPLAAYAVKEAVEACFGAGPGRGGRLGRAASIALALMHTLAVWLLLLVRGAAVVLLVPTVLLAFLEHARRRPSGAVEHPARAGRAEGGGLLDRARWAGVPLCTSALLALAFAGSVLAPRAMVGGVPGPPMLDRHPFWHTIWCSLGEFPNELQFRWSDEAANNRAEFLAGHSVQIFSPEYEAILKDDVLSTLRAHPDFLARVLLQKMAYRLGPFLLALGVFGLSAAFLRPASGSGPSPSSAVSVLRRQFSPAAYIGLPLVANRVLVTLSSSLIFFYFPSLAGEWLAVATLAAMIASLLALKLARGRRSLRADPASLPSVLAPTAES